LNSYSRQSQVTQNGSCPTCRHKFLDIRPPSDSDEESSDGGEYIPNLDEEDDDDTFEYDGEDAEFYVDQVEMESDAEVFGEDFADEDMERDVDTGEWSSEPEYEEGSSSSGITDLDEVEVGLELAELGHGRRGKCSTSRFEDYLLACSSKCYDRSSYYQCRWRRRRGH
jgi:hypothetical protein